MCGVGLRDSQLEFGYQRFEGLKKEDNFGLCRRSRPTCGRCSVCCTASDSDADADDDKWWLGCRW